MSRSMGPLRPLGGTIVGGIVAAVSRDPTTKMSVAASIVVLTVVSSRAIRALGTFVTLSVPFLVPLLVIHGFLNPHFMMGAKDRLVPYRPAGVYFALSIYSGLALILAIGIS